MSSDNAAELTHCCSDMVVQLEDQRVPILYNDKVREYALRLYDEDGPTEAIHLIHFCPWCGDALPQPLRDEFFEAVWAIRPEFALGDVAPEGYRNGGWWRRLGL